jgi:hypothetical protein
VLIKEPRTVGRERLADVDAYLPISIQRFSPIGDAAVHFLDLAARLGRAIAEFNEELDERVLEWLSIAATL